MKNNHNHNHNHFCVCLEKFHVPDEAAIGAGATDVVPNTAVLPASSTDEKAMPPLASATTTALFQFERSIGVPPDLGSTAADSKPKTPIPIAPNRQF